MPCPDYLELVKKKSLKENCETLCRPDSLAHYSVLTRTFQDKDSGRSASERAWRCTYVQLRSESFANSGGCREGSASRIASQYFLQERA